MSLRMTFGRYDYAAFLSFFAYAAGSVIVPVALVELARELAFPLEEGGLGAGGLLHLGRTVPMVAALLLCGFLAGRWGKRRTFGWSVLLMAAGVGMCAVAPVYGLLFLGLAIAGLGEGVIEGLATPFVQDLHPDDPARYINFTHAFWSVGVLVTVLVAGAGLSLGVSWRVLTAVVAAVGVGAAALVLWVGPRARPYPEHPEPLSWRRVGAQAGAIMRRRRFWVFFAAMFLAGGGEFCLTFWSAAYIQLHFAAAPWAGGVGVACFAAGMVVGRTGWGYLVRGHQLRALVVWSAVVGTAVTALFPLLTSLWLFLVLLFVAGLATAPFWPSVQSHAVARMPALDSTMLFILLSCAGIPGCGVLTWLMGVVGNSHGLAAAFWIVPACYLGLAVLVAGEGFAPRIDK